MSRYITVKKRAEDSFEEKKSEFIGYVKRVTTEEEAKEFVAEIKSMHKQARHNCYAYVVGKNMGIQRYSDDGEPQGTAGIPILEVIKKQGITDCAVVVTRYFGGILLGAGGLTRAYTKGAAIAIDAAGVIEKVDGARVIIDIDYDLYGKIQYICGQNNWFIEDTEFTDGVRIYILAKISDIEKIEKEVVEATSAKAKIEKDMEDIYFKEGNRLYINIEE
ncbi:MAG: YigZ family protein [Sarcina sp.]